MPGSNRNKGEKEGRPAVRSTIRRNFHNFPHDLPMLGIALDVYGCRNRFRKRLGNLDFRHACCIGMRLHHLQKARPDMLGAGGMDRKCRMPMSRRGRADQFPGFRPARFADHHSMRAGAQGRADQVIHGHRRRSTADLRPGDRIHDIPGIALAIPIPTIQHNLVAVFHNKQPDRSARIIIQHLLQDALTHKRFARTGRPGNHQRAAMDHHAQQVVRGFRGQNTIAAREVFCIKAWTGNRRQSFLTQHGKTALREIRRRAVIGDTQCNRIAIG